VAALETYRRVVGDNSPLGNVSTMTRQTFISGKAGFLIDGPWVYALFKSAPDTVRPGLRMIAPPFAPHTGGAANSLHIPAGLPAERKELVWQFIRFSLRPEWQRRYFLLTSSPPGLPGALMPAELATAPQLGPVAEAAKGAQSFFPLLQPVQENVAEFTQIVTRMAVRVITTAEPVARIAEQAQAELQKAIPLG
jgi:multiple sugar transport system substrate-binding protein